MPGVGAQIMCVNMCVSAHVFCAKCESVHPMFRPMSMSVCESEYILFREGHAGVP